MNNLLKDNISDNICFRLYINNINLNIFKKLNRNDK